MMRKSVLLDTSFFIRFLNDNDPLFKNADGYFRYFIKEEITMIISTISIAEYCVGGDIYELPLKNLRIVPFNLDHSKKTGEFAKIIFKNKGKLKLNERNIIPNDTKLFSQAHCEKTVEYYLSSDSESLKIYNLLKGETNPKFIFIDLKVPHYDTFGILDL
ncbi:hypothetical protein [Flavobacterium branchiophilum]|uniref:PIN domain-containing protein n=1 Tax=Flavobacterium branchiophilum TaxID=55197 RepID=A0A543G2U8_9FLAO|nr:hypothetical protein [Flavobacterium branchiophilum]TQM40344.1 hypothetical protein BC670_1227 [Flavobacterium branchiophilum]GEM56562.1 hypothetical protein FB1_27830 [Flavobacterium branchiophilum NBRC 15030 = ATCC 35035]